MAGPTLRMTPSDCLVDVVSLDSDGKFYVVLNPSEPLSHALKLMADYQNTGDDYKAALAPAGMHMQVPSCDTLDQKIRELEALASNKPADARTGGYGSDATEATLNALGANVANGFEPIDVEVLRSRKISDEPDGIEIFLLQYECDTGERVWFANSFSDAEAVSLFDALERDGSAPQVYRKVISESGLDDAEEGDEPEPRNMRVAVMRGNGKIDIVSGLMTREEAAQEANKYENIEGIYTVREWDEPISTTNEPSKPARYDIDEVGYRFRGESIRKAFRHHWQQVNSAIDLIGDASDLGRIAKSLRTLCDVLGHEDNFLAGWQGDDQNTDLLAALGYEVDEPARA